MTEKLIIKKSLTTYQTDRFGNMRILMIMNELQALSDIHAEILGVGRTFCAARGFAWIVLHYIIDIIESPCDGEELTFITWPSDMDLLKATRDFEIRGADGRTLVRASSQWILIDLARRRPLKLSENMPPWDFIPEKLIERPFEKMPDFVPQKTRTMNCRFDDVDINQHINNAVYVVWATESAGFDFRNKNRLAGIEINFKKEISPDVPSVEIQTLMDSDTSRHKIISDGTLNANIICRWEKI